MGKDQITDNKYIMFFKWKRHTFYFCLNNKNLLKQLIMKKLVLTLVAVGGMFFATQGVQAQEAGEATAPQAQQTAQQHDDFKKIEVDALPQAVQDALASRFEGAATDEAWVQEKDGAKKYKLHISQNGQATKIYIDEEGNLLKDQEALKHETQE